jgi:hypothetical protein
MKRELSPINRQLDVIARAVCLVALMAVFVCVVYEVPRTLVLVQNVLASQGMSIIGVLVLVAVIGFVLWLVTTYVPMAPPIKAILVAIVVIVLAVWLLNVFGLIGGGTIDWRGHPGR